MKSLANKKIELFRRYQMDHDPDGWPAVQQQDLSEAADIMERHLKTINRLKKRLKLAEEDLAMHGQALRDQWGDWEPKKQPKN